MQRALLSMSHRHFIIGDIHGCHKELLALLDQLNPTHDDRFIFLGDLINRGPDSLQVLRTVAAIPNTQCIVGNHELRFLRYHKTGKQKYLKNKDLALYHQLEAQDWAFLKRMVPSVYLPDYDILCVHGGFLPDRPWQEQGLEITARIQTIDENGKARKRSACPDGTFWADTWKHGPFVVYGHTPRFEIDSREHSLGIDTACVYGGALTALVLPEREIVQVQAAHYYA